MMKTLAACASTHGGQQGLTGYNSGADTVHCTQVSCEVTGDVSAVGTLRTLIGLLPRVSDHVSRQQKLFIKPVELPSTLRARQGRGQVPRA